MKQVFVELPSIETVKEFVDTISQFESEFDLLCGRYVVDAKSIMGVLSLNLSEAITLQIYADEPELDEILTAIKPFLKKEA